MSKECGFHMETMWCPHLKPCTWKSYGVHMEAIWFPCGNHIVSTWESCGDHMDTIWWTQCGYQVDTTWFPCEHQDIRSYVTSVAIRSWKMTNLWMPVTSLIMVRFSIRKKFWKALGLLYQMLVKITGKQWKWWGKPRKWWGKPQTGFLLNIRLKMLSLVVSTSWFPPLWCHGFHPVVSCLVCGLKLD